MSIKKNNTYFQENDGKVYYYDEEGVKKEVPSTAFSDLQDQIDNLGKPLTYSGDISVTEANELTEIKQGTVYTVTGASGTLTAGNVEVKQGDEIAWAEPKWVEIGKDLDNSWKQWSEDNGSIGTNSGIYIGKNNSSDYGGVAIGTANSAKYGAITIGERNIGVQTDKIFGTDNSANGEDYIFGSNNNVSGYVNTVAGNYNEISGNANTIVGRSNSAIEQSNKIIGEENIVTTNSNTVIGDNNKVSGQSYATSNTILGKSNIASGKAHNVFLIGENNITPEMDGAGHSYVYGYENSAGDDVALIGTANSSQPGGFYKAAFGWENKVGNSNNIVVGGNNSATQKTGKVATVVGHYNQTSGGYAFGERNKVSAESYAFGYNNSANGGATTVGKNNSGDKGSYAIGDGSKVNLGGYSLGSNSALNGSHILGRGNFAANGGGMFGYNNLGGKGGYIIGDQNWIYYYDSQTSSYSAENVSEFIDENGNFINGYKIPAQFAFGYQNNIYHGDGPSLGYAGTYFQIGYYNSILSYYRDEDTGIYYGAGLNNGPGAEYNIGRYNSAVNAGINIGASNIILTGDSSVGASINIGKYLKNRYGVLIGQSISSYGYGIGIGSYIPYVNAGDNIFGFGINVNSGNLGPYTGLNARTIIGREINGYATYDSNIFGSYITAYSGYVPTGNNEYCDGIGYGSIAIGTHIKGAAQYGSMIIAQNGENADRWGSNNGSIVPIVAKYDSTVIGGYSLEQSQSAYYRKPGISAYANALILGQGQQMTAGYNSMIIGDQSIAYYGSKVFGSHGWAEGASMVLNPSPLLYQTLYLQVNTINGRVITAAPEIYGSNTARGIYYKPNYESNPTVKEFNPSGQIFRYRDNNTNNSIGYFSYFNRTNATNENLSYFAFNLTSYCDSVRGYWNSDYTVFTPDNSYAWNGRKINWHKGAFVLLRENGVNTLYEYNENTSGNGKFPLYARNNDYYYYYAYYNNSEYGANRTLGQNILSDSIISDGTYIYHIPVYRTGNGSRGWSNISSNVPTSFSGSYCFEASAAYFNSDGTVDIHIPQNITAYGFNGTTGQIQSTYSSVYPSAVYDASSMITDTTAKYGSIVIGQKNSAYGGSIAINTQAYEQNGTYTAQHSLEYSENTAADYTYYYKYNKSTSTINQTYKYVPLHRYDTFNTSADAKNISNYASVAIGVGNYNKNIIENGSLGIGKNVSANSEGYVIGDGLTAYGKAMAIGFNASAGSNSIAINANTGYGAGATAYGGSMAIGACATAYDNSFCFNIPTMNNNSFNYGYADDGGFAMGQGCTAMYDGYTFGGKQYAARHSIAIGMKGGYGPFGNRESYDGNYADDISLAIGFNNYAYKNSWAIGFNNNVKEFGWTFGFNNYLWGFGMFLGFGNHDWVASGGTNYSEEGELVDIFGRWNEIVGYIPKPQEPQYKSVNYESTIIGNNNKLIITGYDWLNPTQSYSYSFDGIFLGKQNECYMASPGGYNIYLGSGNKGCYEAINIGTDNDTMGHSISLGWHNRAVKGGYAHTILIGNRNTSKNTQGYIYSKSYPAINQHILTTEEKEEIQNQIDELTTQRSNEYQNSANEKNAIYTILTSNGMNAVCAENYLNGRNGNYWLPSYYYGPWEIGETRKFSYRINGTSYTGTGESAYMKETEYLYSGYYTASPGDYGYDIYQKLQTTLNVWRTVSSIYTAYYGNNYSSRYDNIYNISGNIKSLNNQIFEKNEELYENPVTSTTTTDSHNIETMSLVVGQGNSADHHNSIIIGSENHSLKMVNDSTTGDDGFTMAIGVGNTVLRNYDMAIGYGVVASGGENIVIGVPYEFVDSNYNRFTAYTSAVGVRNIAVNADITGMDNIAIKSYISGNGITADNDYHTNFNKNILFDSIPIIQGSGGNTAYAINNNIFNDVRSTTISIPYVFDRNDMRVLHGSTIKSNTACDNIYRQVLSSTITTNQDCYNTYENVISSNIVVTGWCNSYNVYKNVTNVNISATYTYGSNLFYDVGGYYSGPFNGVGFTADGNTFAHNIIINAGLYGISNYWTGITNNFFWKSYINPFNTDSKVNSYGDSFTENMLIGTEAYQSVNGSFSFAEHDSGPVGWDRRGSSSPYAAVLKDTVRAWNFGDNSIQHAYDTFVAGLGNEVYGSNRFTVMGGNNFIQLLTKENYHSNNQGDLFHDSIILGNVNTIASNASSYNGYRNTRNYIIGQGNTIIVASGLNSRGYQEDDYNSDLKIFGNLNHFAGIPTGIINSVLNSTTGGSLYSYTITGQEWSYIHRYASILPISTESFNDGYEAFNNYVPYSISGAARNTIIGSKSVISNNITDSISLGSYNAIYQDVQPHDIKFTDINLIGAYNLGINGSHQFNAGFNNITSGHHSTAIGEELRANAFQTILGKYNSSADGTNRTTMRWNYSTNRVEQVENTGVLLAIGNGRLNLYEKWSVSGYNSAYYWYDENNNIVDEKYITTDTYVQRSNAMIVSADGTVSARKFIESEPDPTLTITGGDFIDVTEDQQNNKLIIDLESSLGQMITELSSVLSAKPSTGRHILGVDNGSLTWLEVNQ